MREGLDDTGAWRVWCLDLAVLFHEVGNACQSLGSGAEESSGEV